MTMDNKLQALIYETTKLKPLIGYTFTACNKLRGGRHQILYMTGAPVTLTDINIHHQRVCMYNEQGRTPFADFEISFDLFRKDFDMTQAKPETDAQEGPQEPQKAGSMLPGNRFVMRK